jgi:hypothetical protein
MLLRDFSVFCTHVVFAAPAASRCRAVPSV